MATSINVRLDDDAENRLKQAVQDIKEKTPRGAEVNNSTVVRGAIKEFIDKIDEEKKGFMTIRVNINSKDNDKLKKLLKTIDLISEEFSSGYSEEVTTAIDCLKVCQAIEKRIIDIELEQKNSEKMNDSDKELLEKYRKED